MDISRHTTAVSPWKNLPDKRLAIEGLVAFLFIYCNQECFRSLNTQMPTPIHDFFATSVSNTVDARLREIGQQDDEAGRFAINIRSGGTSRILMKGSTKQGGVPQDETRLWERCPDGQFQHRQAALPGVVIEVSYSQDGKDLEKLAWEFIWRSNGDIKAVVGFDLNQTKASTVSLWRPTYTTRRGRAGVVLDMVTCVAAQVSEPLSLSGQC